MEIMKNETPEEIAQKIIDKYMGIPAHIREFEMIEDIISGEISNDRQNRVFSEDIVNLQTINQKLSEHNAVLVRKLRLLREQYRRAIGLIEGEQ